MVTLSPVTFTVGSSVSDPTPHSPRLEYHPGEPGLRECVLPYADWSEGRAQSEAVVEHDDPEFRSQSHSSPCAIVARVVKSPTVRQARSRACTLFFTADSFLAVEDLAGSTYAGWSLLPAGLTPRAIAGGCPE